MASLFRFGHMRRKNHIANAGGCDCSVFMGVLLPMALWLQQNLAFYGRTPYNQAATRTIGWMQALNPRTGEVVEATAISGVRTYFPAAVRSILDAFPNVTRIASYQGIYHAEQKLVQWALDEGYQIISIGAGRTICPVCAGTIEAAQVLQPFKIFYQ